MNLNGKWFNELGSVMEITISNKNITGTYHTTVGNASGDYELVGQTDNDEDESQSIGFVVLWNNSYGSSDSITSWSGQAQVIDGEEKIVTTWLLTSETDEDDVWHSTLIGKDIFTRDPKPEEKIQRSVAKGIKTAYPKAVLTNLN